LRAVKNEHDRLVEQAISDAKRKIWKFYTSIYGADLNRLNANLQTLEQALLEEKERLALAGSNAPYPVGTRMKKLISGKYRWSEKKTVFGVLEAVTRETVIPDNLASYSRPTIGSYVIRILKADGTPSKKIEQSWYGWVSEDPALQEKVEAERKAAAARIQV